MAKYKDAQTQAIQAVLRYEDCKPGACDGEKGPLTNGAKARFAQKYGIKESDGAALDKAILDRLKDPDVRQAMIDGVKNDKSPDSVVAAQVALKAAGHDTMRMRDPITGMMNGVMNSATQTALSNTEGGRPTGAAYASLGVPESATNLALAGGGGKLTNSFDVAAKGIDKGPAANSPVYTAKFDPSMAP